MGESLSLKVNEMQATTETEFLIVGAGPAGGSLSCFLARYGLKGITISAAPGTAREPRAHLTNMATFDALRDLGVEEECKRLATSGQTIEHIRWCETMAGEEYARVWAWGNDPARIGDVAAASPCNDLDLPQTLLEPILIKYATVNGFKVRYDTEFIRFENLPDGRVASLVKDKITSNEYTIVSKYLLGADGGRSPIAKQLELPMNKQPVGGLAYNVLVRADMRKLMPNRTGNLHWALRLEKDYPFMVVWRMVKPWHEWLFVIFPKPGATYPEPTKEEWGAIVQDLIGDTSISTEIVDVSKWLINETYAEKYSKGNVFCLGDAVHRHPPTNGLGSNTGIQDSFNLAWKLNLASKGLASPQLLGTYNDERQPVGAQVVKRSNLTLKDHMNAWGALGCFHATPKERLAACQGLGNATEEAKVKRKELREALANICAHESNAQGLGLGQRYSSAAVVETDELVAFAPSGKEAKDPVKYYTPVTYPGRRLPHAWLNKPIPQDPISILDLAGKGTFCLLTGVGGDAWKIAAANVAAKLRVPITAYSVGWRQDWEDMYLDWAGLSGVEDDGAILVRPDLFIAWRAQTVLKGEIECEEKLESVMRSILCL